MLSETGQIPSEGWLKIVAGVLFAIVGRNLQREALDRRGVSPVRTLRRSSQFGSGKNWYECISDIFLSISGP